MQKIHKSYVNHVMINGTLLFLPCTEGDSYFVSYDFSLESCRLKNNLGILGETLFCEFSLSICGQDYTHVILEVGKILGNHNDILCAFLENNRNLEFI